MLLDFRHARAPDEPFESGMRPVPRPWAVQSLQRRRACGYNFRTHRRSVAGFSCRQGRGDTGRVSARRSQARQGRAHTRPECNAGQQAVRPVSFFAFVGHRATIRNGLGRCRAMVAGSGRGGLAGGLSCRQPTCRQPNDHPYRGCFAAAASVRPLAALIVAACIVRCAQAAMAKGCSGGKAASRQATEHGKEAGARGAADASMATKDGNKGRARQYGMAGYSGNFRMRNIEPNNKKGLALGARPSVSGCGGRI